jgi:hypothetical protein
MMAGLFLLFSVTLGFLFFGKKRETFYLLLITLFFCALMLWHHATDTLKVNL